MGFLGQTYQKRIVKNKYGMEKLVVEDCNDANKKAELIKKIYAKDNCDVIFRDLLATLGEVEHLRDDHRQFYQMLMKREELFTNYQIYNTAIKLRSIHGVVLLNAILARAECAKKLFIQDVERIEPKQIPKDLSQSSLPLSMRYYDPILAIVQENVADEVKQRSVRSMSVAFEKFAEYNQSAIAWKLFCDGVPSKMTPSYVPKSVTKTKELVNYHVVPSAMELQRSPFLSINEDISNKNLLRMAHLFT